MEIKDSKYCCDLCRKDIPDRGAAIQLPKGDLDSHGIWFGDLGEWLWFHDEDFCSFLCMNVYIKRWRRKTMVAKKIPPKIKGI